MGLCATLYFRLVNPASRLGPLGRDPVVGGSNLGAGKVGLIFRISLVGVPLRGLPLGTCFGGGGCKLMQAIAVQ